MGLYSALCMWFTEERRNSELWGELHASKFLGVCLVWKQDTDLGEKEFILLLSASDPGDSQQDATTLALLQCSAHHSAPATVLYVPSAPGKVASSRGAPAPTALCLLCVVTPALENCSVKWWGPADIFYTWSDFSAWLVSTAQPG